MSSARIIKNVFVHHCVRVIGIPSQKINLYFRKKYKRGTPPQKINLYSRSKYKGGPPGQLSQAFFIPKRIKSAVATKKA